MAWQHCIRGRRPSRSGEEPLCGLVLCYAAVPEACASRGYAPDFCISFELWSAAPLPPAGGWVLLGEVDKFIGVSPQRLDDVTTSADALSATLVGAPGERVHVALLDCRNGACDGDSALPSPLVVDCTLGATGGAALSATGSAAPSCRAN